VFGDAFPSSPRQGLDSRDRLAELTRDARRHPPDDPDGADIPVAVEVSDEAPPRPGRASPPGPGPLVRQWRGGRREVTAQLREAVGRHRVAAGLAALVAVGGLGALLYGAGSAPRAQAPPPLPAAVVHSAAPSTSASTPIVVSVVGKVHTPGLVTVPHGARVAEALQAAGGALPGTNLLGLNLARKVTDGQQILVGVAPPPGASSSVSGAAGADAAGGKVDLNTADADALEELPDVGEVTAKRILAWRDEHGRFSSTGQLRDVDGIGPKTYDELKDLVTVG
jgi:competence protein ComEA